MRDDLADLRSDKALVCSQTRVNDAGAGEIWFVVLADGYLLDCGLSRERATAVARAINRLPTGERP